MPVRAIAAIAVAVCLFGAPRIAIADERLKDDITPFATALLEQLRAKKFTELEGIENDLRTSKARFAGGDWKLHQFYTALSGGLILRNAAIDSDWLELIALQTEWRTASPKSPVPPLLLAMTYSGFGWDKRTSKRAKDVSQHRFDVFRDRLNQGAFYLNESRRLSTSNPQWFTAALRIAIGLGWAKDQATTLFNQAVALEPLYQHTYSVMAQFLLPRWYGDPGEWETFAAESTSRVGGQQGSAIYHHIIVRISQSHGREEMFAENNLNWRRIQWSFADRERLYGESREAVNAMCWLAGAADDLTAARSFMARIGDSWAPSIWITRQRFDTYQEWLKKDAQ